MDKFADTDGHNRNAEHRDLLDDIAEALAKKRYLISDDFKRIKAGIAA